MSTTFYYYYYYYYLAIPMKLGVVPSPTGQQLSAYYIVASSCKV